MYDKMEDGVYTCLDGTLPGPMEPRERVRVSGENCLVRAPDFHHVEAGYGGVAELKENLTGMFDTVMRRLLGANAARVGNLRG